VVLKYGDGRVRIGIFISKTYCRRKAFNKLKWKRLKDMFTLVKNWSEVFKSLIVWQQSIFKEKKIFEELDQYDNKKVGD
jgi:hypothetical protein